MNEREPPPLVAMDGRAAGSARSSGMRPVQSLACPTCGAPLPAAAANHPVTCAFCGTSVAPAPREVERVAERVVERVIVQSDPEAATRPRCPRCDRPLEDVRSAAKVVGVCTRCGGVFVDQATSEYLTRVDDPDLTLAVRRAAGVVRAVSLSEQRATVFCPVCGEASRRVEVAGTVHVVDVCEAHGTWFDHDELAGFVEAFTDQRAGEITKEDLASIGVGGGGFLSRVFRAVFS